MLDLDSDRWHELRHAYGAASGIPALLRGLQTAEVRSVEHDRDPWFSLWSALCHQDDVYPASFAALPHIVAAAGTRSPADRAEFLVLAGTIESIRHRRSLPVPRDLAQSYADALRVAVPLALEALGVESDATWFRGGLGALAAFRGFPELGAALSELQRDIDCPQCGSSFIAPGFQEVQK